MDAPLAAGLGLRARAVHDELAELGHPELTPARVLAQHSGLWLVAEPGPGGEGSLEPRLVPARGRLREEPAGSPVTGDWVGLDDAAVIALILERRGALVRRRPGEVTAAQTLAAGVDLALIVEPADGLNARRAERFVALAAAGDVTPTLVVTKADLEEEAHLTAARLAREIGVADAYAVSSTTGEGVGLLRSALQAGTTAVLLGPSGGTARTTASRAAPSRRQLTLRGSRPGESSRASKPGSTIAARPHAPVPQLHPPPARGT